MSELADRPVRVPDEVILIHWWRLFRWFSNLRLVPRIHEAATKPVLRLVRMFYYDGLTRVGKVLLICCFLIFLFSYRIGSDFLLATASVGCGLLAWSVILALVFRPRVEVSRDSQGIGVVGEPFVSAIRIANKGNRTLYNFAVREMVVPNGRWPKEWDRPHQEMLPPNQQCTVSVGSIS